MFGGAWAICDPFPKEFAGIKLPQFAERDANVPQGIEPLHVVGEGLDLLLDGSQFALQRIVLSLDVLDIGAQMCQFFR